MQKAFALPIKLVSVVERWKRSHGHEHLCCGAAQWAAVMLFELLTHPCCNPPKEGGPMNRHCNWKVCSLSNTTAFFPDGVWMLLVFASPFGSLATAFPVSVSFLFLLTSPFAFLISHTSFIGSSAPEERLRKAEGTCLKIQLMRYGVH